MFILQILINILLFSLLKILSPTFLLTVGQKRTNEDIIFISTKSWAVYMKCAERTRIFDFYENEIKKRSGNSC